MQVLCGDNSTKAMITSISTDWPTRNVPIVCLHDSRHRILPTLRHVLVGSGLRTRGERGLDPRRRHGFLLVKCLSSPSSRRVIGRRPVAIASLCAGDQRHIRRRFARTGFWVLAESVWRGGARSSASTDCPELPPLLGRVVEPGELSEPEHGRGQNVSKGWHFPRGQIHTNRISMLF